MQLDIGSFESLFFEPKIGPCVMSYFAKLPRDPGAVVEYFSYFISSSKLFVTSGEAVEHSNFSTWNSVEIMLNELAKSFGRLSSSFFLKPRFESHKHGTFKCRIVAAIQPVGRTLVSRQSLRTLSEL